MTKKRSTIIPKAPLARILTNAGAKRIAASALTVFADLLEERAEEVAVAAVKISKHVGRKTVNGKDVKLAKK